MSEWRVYGCGSASSSRFLQSSYEWIEEDFRLQIDFGYGALYRRCCAELDITGALDRITHLFLSHTHPDHMADVSRLAIAWKYTPGYTPHGRIHFLGTKKTLEDVKCYLDCVGLEGSFDELFVPTLLEAGQIVEINGHCLEAIPACHREGAIGLRIQSPSGRRIAYTGDTGPFADMENHLRDLDLLAIEASFLHTSMETHMTLSQAAELAGAVRPRALMPIHLYPELERLSDNQIREIVAKWYDGDALIAQDGWRLYWEESTQSWQFSEFL